MRALVCNEYGPPESLVIEERDDPVPGEGQIGVDIAAAGINFPDVLAIAGKYQVKTPTPFVPGNEAAGVVSAIGAGVTQFAVGDKVIINTTGGAFAEKCVADVHATAALPDDLSFEQGAGFTVTYGTSYHALKQSANLQPGETVLVLGAAGGVGITAVEIAKAMGARVIAAASSDEKLEFAVSAGADETINYSKVPLKQTVKKLTGNHGADVVYDPVGGELADQAFRATAWHGRYLVIGFACGEIPKFAANIALLKEASIIGVWWGTWATKNPKLQTRNMLEMAELIKAGTLTPRVTESYALDEYVDAFKAITERRARGKVTLRMRTVL
ncbi:MAG: NADPH:quinone oxidoreductase family protein [Gammaproteobacteria bacterium]|nr:NADPH:quinone oxidoreductase family protein [Gammaproteobacteria bacterium]MDH3429640.1 NADPH:quinone oxidoreductase family protein [Gammaproteobacteria bacterium]MDH3432594.1 NADPH:quinone oxidoreductase family protein [Gammaproteobacteria bacterium]